MSADLPLGTLASVQLRVASYLLPGQDFCP